MIQNIGNNVFIDFEPDEFQLSGWTKYRGPVPRNRGNVIAHTSTGTRAPTFDIGTDGSDIVVTRVQGRVAINQNQSWVVTASQSQQLLEHEQGHYYITYMPYVIALRDFRDLRVPIASAAIPRGANVRVQQQLMRNVMQRRINTLMTNAGTAMTRLNSQYDRDTNHGLNVPQQNQWNQRFWTSLTNGTPL